MESGVGFEPIPIPIFFCALPTGDGPPTEGLFFRPLGVLWEGAILLPCAVEREDDEDDNIDCEAVIPKVPPATEDPSFEGIVGNADEADNGETPDADRGGDI
ncbi:hypothetical protein HDU97_006243, partial [Phlyctochytrium planicorne]